MSSRAYTEGQRTPWDEAACFFSFVLSHVLACTLGIDVLRIPVQKNEARCDLSGLCALRIPA